MIMKENIQTNKRYIITNNRVSAECFEDDYERGELGYTGSFDFTVTGKFMTLQQLITAVAETGYCCTDNMEDWYYDMSSGALRTSALVDENSSLASDRDIELWKNGKLKLYNCDIWAPVQVISAPRDLTEDELKAEGITDIED